jgi:hypothetical protein
VVELKSVAASLIAVGLRPCMEQFERQGETKTRRIHRLRLYFGW